MYPITLIVFALCIAATVPTPVPDIDINDSVDENDHRNPPKHIWAVLVAGSHKWKRYRHQANVCHAYKLLRENGIPKDRIITFMYDDIAFNPSNPEPGVIINEPDGQNVYVDVPIDYTGEDIKKDVFLNVLKGNKHLLKGIGSERVVLSTNRDNILIFHTGLGSEDKLLEFPAKGTESDLHAQELIDTFKYLYNHHSYKNVLMVLESSHSGAIFDNFQLPNNINVMAVTAGGPDEDTWGKWCNMKIEPCIAGLFAYSWINHAENASEHLSVFGHYNSVRDEVANTGKEHPQIYGDWNIGMLPISHFIGYQKSNLLSLQNRHVNYNDKSFSMTDRDAITMITMIND